MGHKQVHTGLTVVVQTVSKYLLMFRTQDSGLAQKHSAIIKIGIQIHNINCIT